ncbi:MAG: hypothetical protein R6X29_07120 [Acidimicrobiia bacterium]|jgi:hypothetical protein
MPVTDPRFLAVTILGGAVLGWALGREPGDRVPVLWATGLAAGLGILAWMWWAVAADPPAGLPAAAASLSLGGAVAFGTAALTGRRPAA